MKSILINLLLLISFLGLAQGSYKEDLTKVRPVVPVKKIELVQADTVVLSSTNAVFKDAVESTDQIDGKLKELKSYYEGSTKMRGYRVQVFSGNNVQSAEKVQNKLKDNLEEEFMGLTPPKVYNLYDAPLFRVKVGDYVLKERAFYMLNLIKQIEGFENALLVPDLIDVKKID